MNVGIIVAAGRGVRFGPNNKQFADLGGRPVLSYSVRSFAGASLIGQIILVVNKMEVKRCQNEIVADLKADVPVSIVTGGDTRQASVFAGLAACPKGTGLVWVHDGARPLITSRQIEEMAGALEGFDGLIPALPLVDTMKSVVDGVVENTLPRERLYRVQTPQLFMHDVLLRAHTRARCDGYVATDDAALVERIGGRVAIMRGDDYNIKVTTQIDLALARLVVQERGLG